MISKTSPTDQSLLQQLCVRPEDWGPVRQHLEHSEARFACAHPWTRSKGPVTIVYAMISDALLAEVSANVGYRIRPFNIGEYAGDEEQLHRCVNELLTTLHG